MENVTFNIKKFIWVFLLYVLCFTFYVSPSLAVEFQSPRFKIDNQVVQTQSPPAINTYKLSDVLGEIPGYDFEKNGILSYFSENSLLQINVSDTGLQFNASEALPRVKTNFEVNSPLGSTYEVLANQENSDLKFSLDQKNFQALPDLTKDEPSEILISGKMKSDKINKNLGLRLDNQQKLSLPSYETTVNLILIPSY